MSRVFLDTCVLYPTMLRQILLGVAKAGLYQPLWSPGVFAEWRHAAARSGEAEAALVDGEIALMGAAFPDALTTPPPDLHLSLSLPDPDDTHILAGAIAGEADELLTLNLQDFPTRTLAQHGVIRRDPDGFLHELWASNPCETAEIMQTAVNDALIRKGPDATPRSLMKRARLPRLGKALYA